MHLLYIHQVYLSITQSQPDVFTVEFDNIDDGRRKQ